MTNEAVDFTEKKFQQWMSECTAQQRNSIEFIIQQSINFQASGDLLLARRLMQRAKNLSPDNTEVSDRIRELTEKLKSSGTTLSAMKSSSLDFIKKRPKKWGKILFEKIFNKEILGKPFILCVVFPVLIFACYQLFIASDRFESRAKLIIEKPDGLSTMDSTLAVLSGFGVSSSTATDLQLVKTYIESRDMLEYLEDKLHLKEHYQSTDNDIFSRLPSFATNEDFFKYYLEHIKVEIDQASGVISVYAQGFTPEVAKLITLELATRSEWYINSIGHKLAESQLDFIRGEHAVVEKRLQKAKSTLLTFQQQNGLLDPEAEGAAFQKITYTLAGEIAKKQAELKALKSVMTDNAPQVVVAQQELEALQEQVDKERARLSTIKPLSSSSTPNSSVKGKESVSEILAQYADYKVDMELALKAYTSSLVSLEKARIEAYRKLKYLMVVESATLPEDYQYPNAGYNISLLAVILICVFGIGRIIIATVKELN